MVACTLKVAATGLAALCMLAWPPRAQPADDPAPKIPAKGDSEPTARPYHARYAIYRNGRLTGKIEVTLQQQGTRWILRSSGSGTHGLARILAAGDDEEVTGELHQGRLRPLHYSRHTRVAGMDDIWNVYFDWNVRQISIVHGEDDPQLLDMVEDALDPLSLKLEIRRRMSLPKAPLRFQMVEEDEIDEQKFRLLPRERMETSLGCLLTTPVEKIHRNTERYTRAWHAPELDNIEVRMDHGKFGGNHLEMRITELTLDGDDVTPRPGCAALQSAGPDAPPPPERPGE